MTEEKRLWKECRAKESELADRFDKFSAHFAKIRDDKILDAKMEYEMEVAEEIKKLRAELAPFEKAWLDEYTKR